MSLSTSRSRVAAMCASPNAATISKKKKKKNTQTVISEAKYEYTSTSMELKSSLPLTFLVSSSRYVGSLSGSVVLHVTKERKVTKALLFPRAKFSQHSRHCARTHATLPYHRREMVGKRNIVCVGDKTYRGVHKQTFRDAVERLNNGPRGNTNAKVSDNETNSPPKQKTPKHLL